MLNEPPVEKFSQKPYFLLTLGTKYQKPRTEPNEPRTEPNLSKPKNSVRGSILSSQKPNLPRYIWLSTSVNQNTELVLNMSSSNM
jgi:hypothetical protein